MSVGRLTPSSSAAWLRRHHLQLRDNGDRKPLAHRLDDLVEPAADLRRDLDLLVRSRAGASHFPPASGSHVAVPAPPVAPGVSGRPALGAHCTRYTERCAGGVYRKGIRQPSRARMPLKVPDAAESTAVCRLRRILL